MKLRAALGMLPAIGLFANPALATPLNNPLDKSPHAYTLYRVTNVPLHGAYFVSQNTGEDLQNPIPTSSFITKEVWLRFSNGQWIETGTANGLVTNSISDQTYTPWKGAFIAYNGCLMTNQNICSSQTIGLPGYRETRVGVPNFVGKHNYMIRKKTDGSENYQVYIDYNLIATISTSIFTDPEPNGVDIGIESSDTDCNFKSGTLAYDFWIINPDYENNPGTGGWYPVTRNMGSIVTHNNYNGAKIQFDYPYNNGTTLPAGAVTQSNRLTFIHN